MQRFQENQERNLSGTDLVPLQELPGAGIVRKSSAAFVSVLEMFPEVTPESEKRTDFCKVLLKNEKYYIYRTEILHVFHLHLKLPTEQISERFTVVLATDAEGH